MSYPGAPTQKVLVLGADSRSFLTVIRSLGRCGLDVHVGWHPEDSIALRSRYISRRCQLPAYSGEDNDWLQALAALVEEESYDLVIPCNDQSILPLHTRRDILAPLVRLAIPEPQVLEQVNDKFLSIRLATRTGVHLPLGMQVSTISDARCFAAQAGFPIVAKPQSSYTLRQLGRRRKVRKLDTQEELDRYLEDALRDGEIYLQQNFNGVGAGIELLADAGEILVAFQHLRIHEPLRGGGSSYRKSAPLDPQLLQASRRLMRELRYTGVAMVEFKVNPKSGKWIFVEINGRFWGSLPLAVASGVDFPRYLYEFMVIGRRKFPQHYRVGIHARNLLLDLDWLAANFKADRSDPTLATRGLHLVACEAVNFLLLRERSDTLVLDDPLPGLYELQVIAGKSIQRLWRDATSTAFRLPPLRASRVRRSCAAFREAQSILFLCKGNICRSPFAAALGQKMFPDKMQILSSGSYPKTGRNAPKAAVQVAREYGIDLAGHRSTVISAELMNAVDLIFTFDEENLEVLRRLFPQTFTKVHRLALLDRGGPLEIEDPYGRSLSEFRRVYSHIARALNQLRI